MKLEKYLIERDVAKLPVEDCKDMKGDERLACKIKKYDEYIDSIKKAMSSSESDDETKKLKKSLKFAQGVKKKLRSKK